MLQAFGWRLIGSGLTLASNFGLQLLNPFIVKAYVEFLEERENNEILKGIIIALTLTASLYTSSLLVANAFYHVRQ